MSDQVNVGGCRPGTVRFLDDNSGDAIVVCDSHQDARTVYEAACYDGADLDSIVVSHMGGDRYYVGSDVDPEVTDEYLEAWEDAAAQAGDADTMLIAGIARGQLAPGLGDMSPEEIEANWPTVPDGEEIARLRDHGWLLAARIAETWGSPWPERDYGDEL